MNNIFKFFIPKNLYSILLNIKRSFYYFNFRFMNTEDIFTIIYNKRLWGSSANKFDYYSGWGSHINSIIDPYIKNMRQFFDSFDNRLSIVDLGCGDFNVGMNFVGYVKDYSACDIVLPLIESNKKRYSKFDVKFLHINIIKDDLPKGDLVILRQVLQHLTNAEIMVILSKVRNNYKYLVVTEHVSNHYAYLPNLDHPTGYSTRVDIKSGIDIESEPFFFNYLSVDNLLSINVPDGEIYTKIYTLN